MDSFQVTVFNKFVLMLIHSRTHNIPLIMPIMYGSKIGVLFCSSNQILLQSLTSGHRKLVSNFLKFLVTKTVNNIKARTT